MLGVYIDGNNYVGEYIMSLKDIGDKCHLRSIKMLNKAKQTSIFVDKQMF